MADILCEYLSHLAPSQSGLSAKLTGGVSHHWNHTPSDLAGARPPPPVGEARADKQKISCIGEDAASKRVRQKTRYRAMKLELDLPPQDNVSVSEGCVYIIPKPGRKSTGRWWEKWRCLLNMHKTESRSLCHCRILLRKIHAAFGGAPHQASIGSEEPMDASFSPRGEALSRIEHASFYCNMCRLPPKASP